ncbi:MAG: stage V sporulation protein AE [Thermaerobacter sp.]|nr:stage V sporulation protein AE [Thermaerobacter sp.]
MRADDGKRAIVIVTDGDGTAYDALTTACEELGCFPLRASRGNPTPLDGPGLVEAIDQAPYDPVVVMVDDQGQAGRGPGESALAFLLNSAHVEVLGVVAVAAGTHPVRGVRVTGSVTRQGRFVNAAVDKGGVAGGDGTLRGDTVDVIGDFPGPVVGLGDPGKMDGRDSIRQGAPNTTLALAEVLRRAGWHGRKSGASSPPANGR